MVLFIFCSCCISLNVLFSKIRRILEIKELERTSKQEAQIVSLIYYNSTYAGLVQFPSQRCEFPFCSHRSKRTLTMQLLFIYCEFFSMARYDVKYNYNDVEAIVIHRTAGVHGGDGTRHYPFRGLTLSLPQHVGLSFRHCLGRIL
ncbi:unnamed protein product [Angiostrongylus costaricensis]|uniref:Secreted protein n=1 Tax=Angiostrongylus costaricensis TaxID=334426 RepID=A0A0R3PBT2_ANGCS|nr:unnamed protein product [Angiostrongylus costaricensis]